MLAAHLTALYRRCRDIGLARSKSDFSRVLLGRSRHYMRLVEQRGGWAPASAGYRLRARLLRLAARCPVGLRRDIEAVITEIDAAADLARMFRR